MAHYRSLKRVRFANVLSFGPGADWVPVQDLNILIGANGSGKSNFLSCLELMCASVSDYMQVVKSTGGTLQWSYRGQRGDIELHSELQAGVVDLRHYASLWAKLDRFSVTSEQIVSVGASGDDRLIYRAGSERYLATEGAVSNSQQPMPPGMTLLAGPETPTGMLENLGFKRLAPTNDPSRSILSELKDPFAYDNISELSSFYERVAIYRDFDLRVGSPARSPQPPGASETNLLPDLSNIPQMIVALKRVPAEFGAVVEHLRAINPEVEGLDIDVVGHYLQAQLRMASGDAISSYRMSDGTLRFLCLLLIFYSPNVPPVVCVEEPDLGLHPDAIGELARVLRKASKRTQIIATTHSEDLVSAFTDQPEAVMIAEKDENGTHFRRLASDDLAVWLEDYSLGDLWASGQIGGVL